MSKPEHIAVIDIGKTNAKLVLFDLSERKEIAVCKTPNRVREDWPYPHYDHEALWKFILQSLRDIHAKHRIDAISVTTHGATAVLVDEQGGLSLPILDYEHTGVNETRAAYEALRPDFSETGSPSLPIGLNLGAQIYWQQQTFPTDFAKTKTIMLYPQYWSFRLSGVRASEVTSLGTHTDLWAPQAKRYSSMMPKLGWDKLMAPMHQASDCLGPITDVVTEATGLPKTCPVYCGIHDSNASLLPHLLSRPKPFSVVSTGTWVIVMAVGGVEVSLDLAREMLFNVSADGNPVPTSRFMGGREYELLMEGRDLPAWTEADVRAVEDKQMRFTPHEALASLPSVEGEWSNAEDMTDAQRYIVVSHYLASRTSECLSLIGAAGTTIVEGPFASNPVFLRKLVNLTGRKVEAAEGTGTSLGAALLVR